ncbi:hypothetical protein KVT40_008911 [Elsinoe batatas]|uniref:BTB domain-containing protein n=1 Tax=Elsinoe batatas TaxID=2601811 RepID=A0A8K0KXZ1_9PEZI|nr:hypothetical protein KVT40_008911 [Elsinoe batatas]
MKELGNATLQAMRKDSTFADLTIVCGKSVHRVHRVVVCAASEWFAKACAPGRFAEGAEAKIVLPARSKDGSYAEGDDPDVISAMIDSYYGIDTFESPSVHGLSTLSFYTRIYVTADKYGDKDLAARARTAIISRARRSMERMTAGPPNVVQALSLGSWIGDVYRDTAGWDMTLKQDYLNWLTKDEPQMLENPHVIVTIKRNPELAMDIITLLRNKAFQVNVLQAARLEAET